MNPLLFHPLAGLTESDRIALSFDCFESDGGGGGGFWDSISKFFGGGGGEPGFSGQAGRVLGDAAPGAEAGFSGAAGNTLGAALSATNPNLDMVSAGLNFGKVAGDAAPGATLGNSIGNQTGIVPTFESPGPGVGSAGGPGGGAAGSAAPASVSPDAAARGLDPNVIGQSAGKGTGTGPTSIDTFMSDPSMKNFMKTLGANAGVLLPAAGLGAQALMSQKSPEGLDALRASAERSNNQGAIMQKYLETGTLPPGLQAGLDSAREAAKASIRARYANLPGQSSAMEQELAAADQTAAAKGGELAIQLFQRGMDESNISNKLYEAILQQDLERDKELGAAVGTFTTALAGGGPHVSLNFGGR